MQRFLIIIVSLLCVSLAMNPVQAQQERRIETAIDGEVISAVVTDNDTILMAELVKVSVSAPRKFADRAEYLRYLKYRRYAAKVYPYAVEAIKVFREVEEVTQTMKKRKRKKHIKRLQKQLKKEFKDPLKKLTKTQGMILIEMIERELDTPFHSLVKDLRGGLSAGYWQMLGSLYGYDLKEGYLPEKDPILEAVLDDFDISYTVR